MSTEVLSNAQLAARREFSAMSPDEAIAAIEQMKASREFWNKINTPTDPGHKLAVASWTEVHRAAYPGTEDE